jgi:hypothetical protein
VLWRGSSRRFECTIPRRQLVDVGERAQMSNQTQKAKSRRAIREWTAFALFLAATSLLVVLPVNGLLSWLCFAAFVPFYIWALVAMTEAEDVKNQH